MGERTVTNILSKREPKHNRSIYQQNGYTGENVFSMLRFFRGGEFFNTLTDLEQAEIMALISWRCMFVRFYDYQGGADALIYEDENASVFASVLADPDLYVIQSKEDENTTPFMHYLVGERLCIPIDEYVNHWYLECSDLSKELVARFVKHYNIQPITKENYVFLEKEFFDRENQRLLVESYNAFISENYCEPKKYSSSILSFKRTILGKKWKGLVSDFHWMNHIVDVAETISNIGKIYIPSFPLIAVDNLDVEKPLMSIASVLCFVPTEQGVEHFQFEPYTECNPYSLLNYIKEKRKEIEGLRNEFQQHTDIPLLKGVDEAVVMKVFALMHIAFEIRSFFRKKYATYCVLCAS